jgi:protease I
MSQKKVLVITSNTGIELPELQQPLDFLRSKGIETIHAAIENKPVRTVENDSKPAIDFEPDTDLASVSIKDYALLLIPGGTVNADQLRVNDDAKRIIQYFTDQGLPIAAICHAPWVLIDAERVKGKTLTSYSSIRLDLEHAGAHWLDKEVHHCSAAGWVLITSRCPDDLPAFNQAVLKELDQ